MLISINDIDVNRILVRAKQIERQGPIQFVSKLCNLFYEPSTRTSSSFASAMYLWADKLLVLMM